VARLSDCYLILERSAADASRRGMGFTRTACVRSGWMNGALAHDGPAENGWIVGVGAAS